MRVPLRSYTVPEPGVRVLLRDPVLLGIGVLGLLCCGWYLGEFGSPRLQLVMLWPLQVVMDVAAGVLACRVGARPGLTSPQRRYWYLLATAGLLFAVGDGIQALVTLRDPTPDRVDGSIAQTGFFAAGLVVILVNMLMYPSPTGSRSARLRLWLDSATVMIAGGVLAWCFAADTTEGGGPVMTIATAAGLMVAEFATIRLALSQSAPMTRAAAAPLILGARLQGLPMLIAPASRGTAISSGWLVIRLLPSVLVVFSPRIQEVQARFDLTTFSPRHQRPYRLLPYGAVTVTFAALLLVLPSGLSGKVWGVVTGAVLITCVVVVRQLLIFSDNFRLINRLDATLQELRDQKDRLRDRASHDGLTWLHNRTAFAEHVTAVLAGESDRETLHLLLIDLDDFKTVNDTLGHAVGDALLVTIANRLRDVVRVDDVPARLGGDEFAVLAHGTDDDGEALAARILAEIARPARIHGRELIARATIGVARALPNDSFDELMRNADMAMYAAKAAGKSSFRRYTPNMGACILETAKLGVQLGKAIDSDQFQLHYQPIVSLPEGRMVGVEALVRWQRPGGGLTLPVEFIPIAEQTGLIVPLGRRILSEACRQAAAWCNTYPEATGLMMNVNVSGRQLQEPDFVDEVATILCETGLLARQLTIEVTETAVLRGAQIARTLARLREFGVGLALDDFGTASSSLGLLLTYPVSCLKLDRSFVDGVTTAARPAAVATAVIQMARALDLTAVAEGVETTAQAEFLQNLGYQLAQGFLFAWPQSAEDLAAGRRARRWTQRPERWADPEAEPGGLTPHVSGEIQEAHLLDPQFDVGPTASFVDRRSIGHFSG